MVEQTPKPNNALTLLSRGEEGAHEKSPPLIHVRMGEPFSPVDLGELPDLNGDQFVFEPRFTLEGVGDGYLRIFDVAGGRDSDAVFDLFRHLESPYGRLHIVRVTSPDSIEEDRRTLFPLALGGFNIALYQPKREVVPPVVLVEFDDLSFRYWAIDNLGDAQDIRSYDPNSALYLLWRLEETGEAKTIAFDRDREQVGGIKITFLKRDVLPKLVETHAPRRRFGLVSITPPFP